MQITGKERAIILNALHAASAQIPFTGHVNSMAHNAVQEALALFKGPYEITKSSKAEQGYIIVRKKNYKVSVLKAIDDKDLIRIVAGLAGNDSMTVKEALDWLYEDSDYIKALRRKNLTSDYVNNPPELSLLVIKAALELEWIKKVIPQ